MYLKSSGFGSGLIGTSFGVFARRILDMYFFIQKFILPNMRVFVLTTNPSHFNFVFKLIFLFFFYLRESPIKFLTLDFVTLSILIWDYFNFYYNSIKFKTCISIYLSLSIGFFGFNFGFKWKCMY